MLHDLIPGRPDGTPEDAETYDALLSAQWLAIRDWAAEDPVLTRFHSPSVLAGWTVGDLLAHLTKSLRVIEAARTETEASPDTLLQYVTRYADSAEAIAESTRAVGRDIAADPLPALDESVARSLTALRSLQGPVIRTSRGVLPRPDFVITRLLELVVHGDDLNRSLPDLPPARLLPEAVSLVAAALTTAYTERTGTQPPPHDALDWIRTATGRTPPSAPSLPLL